MRAIEHRAGGDHARADLAIADESKKARLRFAGHVPNSMTVAEASDAGESSVEHLLGILTACSSRESELGPGGGKFGESLRAAAESYDARKEAALFAKFVRNDTWQTPTLAVLRGAAHLGDPELSNDNRLRTLPPTIAQFWQGAMAQANPADLAARKQQFKRELKLVGAMHRAWATILAGCDTPNPYVYPGWSLHQELQLLVEAGLSPIEAIQCATIRAAHISETRMSPAPSRPADWPTPYCSKQIRSPTSLTHARTESGNGGGNSGAAELSQQGTRPGASGFPSCTPCRARALRRGG
jgi:imidazolonepropionase-like amidohydrolase